MVSKTDNDLALMLYRCYRSLQARLGDDEDDLDRRFDKIMENVGRQQRRDARSKCASLHCAAHLSALMRRARTSALGQAGTGGAAAAVTAKLTQFAQGWVSLGVAMATGALTAVAVVAVIDVRSLKRTGRARRRREDPAPSPHP
ncbi:hypothetical protein AB0E04_47745 [Streptomyces sp. NPDC048251]|uniref:hypothetical protein n=1 Tax=unclassified Streptomyces TaxID=2593676 RepID=UPI003328269D